MARKDGEVEEGTEVVRRTIVGGRPMERRRRKVRIPIGIEKVLCRAAGDGAFRERLFRDRAAAVAALGDGLSAGERAVLAAVPEDVLRTMISNIDLKRHRRRSFFRGIAAASLAATTAVGTTECLESSTTGIDPSGWDAPRSDVVDAGPTLDSRGAVPDEIEGEDLQVAGILDDVQQPELPDIVEVDEAGPIEVGNLDGTPPDEVEHLDGLDGGMWADTPKTDAADTVEVDLVAPTGILPDTEE
jgi:hypothetical protein